MSLTPAQARALQQRLRAAASQIDGRPIAEHVEWALSQPAHKSHAASDRFKAKKRRMKKAEQ